MGSEYIFIYTYPVSRKWCTWLINRCIIQDKMGLKITWWGFAGQGRGKAPVHAHGLSHTGGFPGDCQHRGLTGPMYDLVLLGGQVDSATVEVSKLMRFSTEEHSGAKSKWITTVSPRKKQPPRPSTVWSSTTWINPETRFLIPEAVALNLQSWKGYLDWC